MELVIGAAIFAVVIYFFFIKDKDDDKIVAPPNPGPGPIPPTGDALNQLTKAELIKYAQDNYGVTLSNSFTKARLIEEIIQLEVDRAERGEAG